jgi:hypothetical protein
MFDASTPGTSTPHAAFADAMPDPAILPVACERSTTNNHQKQRAQLQQITAAWGKALWRAYCQEKPEQAKAKAQAVIAARKAERDRQRAQRNVVACIAHVQLTLRTLRINWDGPSSPTEAVMLPNKAAQPGRDIIVEVALLHGLTETDLRGPSKARRIARARWQAMARIHNELGYSLPKVGKMFSRDHTTVLHGVRQWAAQGEAILAALPPAAPTWPGTPPLERTDHG